MARRGRHIASQIDVCVKIVGKKRAGESYKLSIVDSGGYEAMLEMSKMPHRNLVRYPWLSI